MNKMKTNISKKKEEKKKIVLRSLYNFHMNSLQEVYCR